MSGVTTDQARIPDAEYPVVALTADECWRLLESDEFGRLAFRMIDEVHLVPLNYVVDGRTLLFRTAPGNKLFAAALHSEVAFEVDWRDEEHAWSVVVRGRIRRLAEDEGHRADQFEDSSWIPTMKYEVVLLTPEAVTGRRFFLRRPPTAPARGGPARVVGPVSRAEGL